LFFDLVEGLMREGGEEEEESKEKDIE